MTIDYDMARSRGDGDILVPGSIGAMRGFVLRGPFPDRPLARRKVLEKGKRTRNWQLKGDKLAVQPRPPGCTGLLVLLGRAGGSD